jgi:hypothetical protein
MVVLMPGDFAPFSFSEKGSLLSSSYPDPETLKAVYRSVHRVDQFGVLRLLITEGIPFAYKSNPLAYEAIRAFIAERLSIDPKGLILVGSARVGYSLSKHKWGKAFSSNSDLDFAIVSNSLFRALVKDLSTWVDDMKSRRTRPTSIANLRKQLMNIDILSLSTSRGFIQTNLFPYSGRYPAAKRMHSSIWLLIKRISNTHSLPNVPRSSIRVYADRRSFLAQLHLNFRLATKS